MKKKNAVNINKNFVSWGKRSLFDLFEYIRQINSKQTEDVFKNK